MTKCGIIGDLLPAYVGGLASDDTRALVDEHIAECEDCRDKLAEMRNRVVAQLREKDAKSISVFKKMKKKILLRNVLAGAAAAAAVTVIAVFAGTIIVDYKPIAYYDGLVNVQENQADYYETADGASVVITDPAGNNGNQIKIDAATPQVRSKIAVLDLTCTRNYNTVNATGRTIVRDGETINVDYICYLANRLTQGSAAKGGGEKIFRLVHADSPVKTEVYYLTDVEAVSNSKLSDAEFDNYRHQGTLIWSGKVG